MIKCAKCCWEQSKMRTKNVHWRSQFMSHWSQWKEKSPTGVCSKVNRLLQQINSLWVGEIEVEEGNYNRWLIETSNIRLTDTASHKGVDFTGSSDNWYPNTDLILTLNCCSVAQLCIFATPWVATSQAFLSFTNSRSLLKLTSFESVMSSNHLLHCYHLLLRSIFPSIRLFSNESVLHIRWPKYWSSSLSIGPSSEHSGKQKKKAKSSCFYW